MTTFKVPSSICKELDKLAMKFLWSSRSKSGKYMALKSWDDICKTKGEGGLGFHRFSDINLALLAKLAWSIASEEETLWCRILRTKYLRGQSFFHYEIEFGVSNVWRGILSTRQWIMKGVYFQVGDGASIDVWSDP